MNGTFGWTDIEDIAIALHDAHKGVDPFQVKFTDLRSMVESLDGFQPDAEHNVNEQILEAIQVAWQEEIDDAGHTQEHDPDEPSYRPNDPYR